MSLLQLEYTEIPNFLSSTQLSEHYKLYEGYYNGAKDLPGKINGINITSPQSIRGMQKNLQYALAGRDLHEVYFGTMQVEESSINNAPENLKNALVESFGSVETFVADMKIAAASARGWYRIEQDPKSGQLYHNVGDFHDEGSTSGFNLVLALDMYDHAYFFDYQTRKVEYIEKYLKHVNWNKIAERLV